MCAVIFFWFLKKILFFAQVHNDFDYSDENFLNLETSSKKKIFIHIPYEKNERNWNDFYASWSCRRS